MTKAEKAEIIAKPLVAYYSGFGGVEIKECNDDYVIYVANAWHGAPSVHQAKLRFNQQGEPFFKVFDSRVYLNECIRS